MFNPCSLYNSSLSIVSHNYQYLISDLQALPPQFKFNILSEMLFKQHQIDLVALEIGQLEVFLSLLSVRHKRPELHRIFEIILNHGHRLHHCLSNSLICLLNATSDDIRLEIITVTLNYADFLSEAGWWDHSQKVLKILIEKIRQRKCKQINWLDIECQTRLLCNLSRLCRIDEAKNVFEQLNRDYLSEESENIKVIYTVLLQYNVIIVIFSRRHRQFIYL